MDYIKQIKDTILESLPKEALVTTVDLEGPEIAIYTKNPKMFFENQNLVAKAAFDLKKRINIRTDKSLLTEENKAEKTIREIVPQDADIRDISFNPAFSEVVIEAIKPGLVIGKGGETSKQIILETGWTPNIIRAPTSPSKILKGLRNHLHKYSSERKKILQDIARKIYAERSENAKNWIRLHALGAFREVGRSCVFVETPYTKVLLDCGVNVANNAEPYPYLDALNFSVDRLDAVIISHAHLDHSGMLPYLFRLGYRGPVYLTKPSRDLMCLLQFDYIDVLVKEGKEPPYTEQDIKEMIKYCITREYREVTDIAPDMRLTFHNASHILGSSSVHLHIGNGQHNLVYSGDIKFGFTRLFNDLDLNFPRIETLIIESTYGSKMDIHPKRMDAEKNLIQVIKETIQTGGNVLIPVFAVGRAQEIMLVLEEGYKRGELDGINVYVDGMTKEASAVHTAYPEYLRSKVQRRILQNDSPFTSEIFKEATWDQRDEILAKGSAVILASSGMLTGGASLDYLTKMSSDPNNTIVFVGFQGQGSTGRKIQSGIKSFPITAENSKTKELVINMRVETIEGFSVPYETDVMIKRNNLFELIEIGKLADEFLPKTSEGLVELKRIQVPAFDFNGKISWHAVSHLLKHKSKDNHLLFKTKSGKEIQVSKGHSLFCFKNKAIQALPANKLTTGSHIVIPNKLPESHSIHSIQFQEFVDNKNYVLNEELNKFEPMKGGNKKSFLISECKDMKKLARFLGYYISEGNIEKGKGNRAILSFGAHEKNLIEDAIDCSKTCFGITPTIHKPHKTETQLRIHNKMLVEFLEQIGCGERGSSKRVPKIVLNFSIEVQKEFLKAYFEGDGYIYKNGGKGYLAAKSISKKLVSDLSYLLLQHGIVPRIKGPIKEKARELNGNFLKESIIFKIYLSEKDFTKIQRNIGIAPFALPLIEINLRSWYTAISNPKLRKLANAYINALEKKGRSYIGLHVLRQFLNALNESKLNKKTLELISTLKCLSLNDILVDVITEIKEVSSGEFEYDFVVPGKENFVGGFGGIMLHNSGHSDRSELTNYIRTLKIKPKRVIVDHGEKSKAIEFAKFITAKFKINSTALQNLDAIRLE